MQRLHVVPMPFHRLIVTSRPGDAGRRGRIPVKPVVSLGMVLLFLILTLLTPAPELLAPVDAAPLSQNIAGDLLITKYIDGSSNNKAIEIYNGTGSPRTLSQYQLEVYSEATANTTAEHFATLDAIITDRASINNQEAIVIHLTGATAANGYPWDGLVFDGGDAIILRELSSAQDRVIDSFGRTTNVPGGAWVGGGITTRGTALRRKSSVCSGRADSTVPFDPSLEWELIPGNPYEQLGTHELECGPQFAPPILNEFVFDHISNGVDDREFIEVKINARPTNDVYSVLLVDGSRSTNPGVVYYSKVIRDVEIPVNGYWTRFENNRFDDSSNTLLLVRNYTPPAGDPFPDIDQNDDGLIDLGAGGIPPYWTEVIDDVAVLTDGNDFAYAQQTGIALHAFFDGEPTPPGGASRIPDGQHSSPFDGWKRNHFDGEGLGCVQCVAGATNQVAVNTPGELNRLGEGAPTPTHTPTGTLTGVPTGGPTATHTPTGTPGPTATATNTATPLPGYTPPPPGCEDIINDGSFEEGYMDHMGWKFGDDPVPARYSGDQRRFGLRSVLLGNPPDTGTPNVVSYSSVRQLVKIPAGASTAYLTWSHLSLSQETPREPTRWTDRQEFIPLAPNQMPISIKYRDLLNESNWRDERRDMTDLIGKNFYVYFNVFNDGNGQRTWMYLDNVQLIVCYPGGVVPGDMETPTPMPPGEAPQADTRIEPPADTPIPPPTQEGDDVDIRITVDVSTSITVETTVATPAALAALPVEQDAGPVCAVPACPNGRLVCGGIDCSNNCGLLCLPEGNRTGAALLSRPQTLTVATTPQVSEGEPAGVPEGCRELLVNGDFEELGLGWDIKAADGATGYTTAVTHAGSRQAMQVGSLDGEDPPGDAMVMQEVMIPADVETARLEFWYYPRQSESDVGPGDFQHVDIYRYPSLQFEDRVFSDQRGDREWLQEQIDLTKLAGQQIQLRLAVTNDGLEGHSDMVVDDVSILACGGIVREGGGTVIMPPPKDEAGMTWSADADNQQNAADSPADSALSGFSLDFLGRLGIWAVLLGILVVVGILGWALSVLFQGYGWALPIVLSIVGITLLVWYLTEVGASLQTIVVWVAIALALAVILGFIWNALRR